MNIIVGNVLLIVFFISFVFLFLGIYIYFKKAYNMLVKRHLQISRKYYVELGDQKRIIGILKDDYNKEVDDIVAIYITILNCYLIGNENAYRINKINSKMLTVENVNKFSLKIQRRLKDNMKQNYS